MYAPIIFEEQSNSELLSTLMPVIQVVFAFLTIFVIDKWGRRTLLLVGAVICSIGHLICCVALDEDGENNTRNWVFNVGVLIYAGVFNTTYGVITYASSI